jgi:hypothetical protein
VFGAYRTLLALMVVALHLGRRSPSEVGLKKVVCSVISKKYNCIFVHIPKVAGQSIEHFFLDLHGLSWDNRGELLLRYNDDPALGPERLAHLMASEYTRLGYLSQQDFSRYFKFAFVRNPWARLVSEYTYRNHQGSFTFKDFVKKHLPEKNLYTDTYRHIVPQYHYIYDDNGGCLVDFVGRFESLKSDFNRVCESLGLGECELPHVNVSKNKTGLKATVKRLIKPMKRLHYTEYYDEELKDHVAHMYQLDIEAFGYQFEPTAC